ncbi:MAG: HlyD family type I secretion periplasmic adaptor subunit [Candidatus Competibacteraceae bacterium]|nr:HlyD family type I secretion periplasmic adaptor subunit [Candidatus Competibacteraceae bacterium]
MNDHGIVQLESKRLNSALQPKSTVAMARTMPATARSSPLLDDGRNMIRLGLLVIGLTFGGGGALIALAPLAGAVVASGVVKVADNRKSVQHLEGGIVKEIRVRNGDRVTVGQTLVVLEDERAAANLDLLAGQWDATAAKVARLQAEREFRRELEFPERLRARADNPKIAELLRTETTLFQTKRTALERQLKSFEDQSAEMEREQNSLQAQLSAEKEASRLLAEEVGANEAGERRQVVSKVHVLALKRGQQERVARQAELAGAIARSRQRMEEVRARAAAARNQYLQAAADELTTAKALLADLEEKQRPSRDAVHRQAIVAPSAGQVVDLQVFTVGGVVKPGERLMDLVPDSEPLLVEARVGLDDVDDLRLEQAVDIRLTAYPTRTTPLLHGAVRYISADQLSDPRTGAPHYIAQVAVDGASLAAAGAGVRLQAGMHAELFIKTEERTVLDYLLEPVAATLRRALREH